jgi:hypothetical protein
MKGCCWGRNLENVDVQATREREANEEFIDRE